MCLCIVKNKSKIKSIQNIFAAKVKKKSPLPKGFEFKNQNEK